MNPIKMRATRITIIATLVAAMSAGGATAADAPAKSPDIRTRYLLLDSRVIENTENAKLSVSMARKHPANPLFGEDKPWEQRYDNMCPSVIHDEADGLYKLWYDPFIHDSSAKGMTLEQRHTTSYRIRRREDGTCYATSRDGLKWEKPELGLVEYEGGKANNLVLRGPHGPGVFKDARDPDPARRYKMFHARDVLRFSPDGLHWSEPKPCEGIDSNSDTHNNMLWAPDIERYVAIVRLRSGADRRSGQRVVARSESTDLKTWTRAVEVLRIGEDGRHAYSMPVFRYAGIYLGLVAVFRTKEDRVHTELAWSPDTLTWQRIDPGTPLIGNAPSEGEYDWGCVYAADDPVLLDNEIRIYYLGSNGKHTSWRDGFFCLATLPPDRWAGYEQVDRNLPAVVVTRPFKLDGNTLQVNVDAQAGDFRVEILDESGKPIPGFSGTDAPTSQRVDDLRLVPRWQGGADLSSLAGKAVRLRFHLKNAKVYSFQIPCSGGYRPTAVRVLPQAR